MTIQNTYTFNPTEAQIIQRAMELIGASGIGDSITNDDYSLCQDYLNAMYKSWDAYGLHQWKMINATLVFTNTNQNTYPLGPLTTDSAASENMIATTVTSAVSLGASTIVVASVTGMSVGDNIILQQDNGTTLVTTVSAINTGTLTITLNTTTTSTAAIGQTVFDYTSQIQKPMSITDVRRMDSSGNEITLQMLNSGEYFALTNKTSPADPTCYYYQPGLLDGTLYLWPQPSNLSTTINFRYSKQISDLLVSSDTPDLPQEFILASYYSLAALIAPAFGRASELQEIQKTADMLFQNILGWDDEQTNIKIGPMNRTY